MISTETPKSTGVLCGTVVAYKKGKCTIKFSKKMVPGDGIEIWTSKGAHVGTGITKMLHENNTDVIKIEGHIEAGNAVYKSYDKKLIDETKKAKSIDSKKIHIIGAIEAQIGKPVKLALKMHIFPDNTITVESYSKSIVEKAQNAPLNKDEIIKQLSKTGNSPFVIEYYNNAEDIKIDEDIFVSKLALNELRRDAVETLKRQIIGAMRRDIEISAKTSAKKKSTENSQFSRYPIKNNNINNQKLTVQIKDINILNAISDVILAYDISRIYLDFSEDNVKILKKMLLAPSKIFLALPSISRNEDEISLKNLIKKIEDENFNAHHKYAGYLISTYGHLNILQELKSKKKIVLDHNFNIFNNCSKQAFENMYNNIEGITLSQELTIAQLKSIDAKNSEIMVYGRQILMSMHNCPVGLYDAEKEGKYCSEKFTKDKYALLDRKDMRFPIFTDCNNCIAHILNSKTLDVSSKFKEIKSTGIEYLRLVFRDENKEAIKNVITKYEALLSGSDSIDAPKNADCTYGHFFRGVE